MFRAAIRHKNVGEDHRVTMDAKIVSRTPDRDFRCLYPCDIILSHIPIFTFPLLVFK